MSETTSMQMDERGGSRAAAATPPDQVREHAFDGIQEFDNRLPNWWLWTFYLACIFAVGYWFHYHVLGTGLLPQQEFARELKAADERAQAELARRPVTEESLVALSQDREAVAMGAEVFAKNCVACHGANAGGTIGPNLTDAHWIHGAKPSDIYRTIQKGVPEKGMVTWEPLLGSARCQQVTAYVLTLRNTNVAGGKPPEGVPQ